MFQEQNGCCAICKQPSSGNRRLAVDHCHDGQFVRGLLCHRCNMALGHLNGVKVLQEALIYLSRADEFGSNRNAQFRLVSYSVADLLKKKFRKEDWRRCRDPYEKERLLDYEVEKRWVAGNSPNDIAKELGISVSYVKRLNDGQMRYSGPVYYGSGDILWPKCKPDMSLRREWGHPRCKRVERLEPGYSEASVKEDNGNHNDSTRRTSDRRT
jgi:hypothetical protein